MKPVSVTGSTNTAEPVVSFAGSAPLREPSAKAATHCTGGNVAVHLDEARELLIRPSPSQVRSNSAIRCPVNAFMAAVAVAAWRIPSSHEGQDRVLPILRLRHQLPDLFDTGTAGTLRTPRHAASTAPCSSGNSTTSSSIATPASRSSTSRPMTLPFTAPISAATAPRTPGASGSQIRILSQQAVTNPLRSVRIGPRSVDPRHAHRHPHGVLGVAGVNALTGGTSP